MSRYNITASIFQKAKHNPPLSAEEIELCRMVICRDQKYSDETIQNSLHSSIYAFALSQEPKEENVALIIPYVDPKWDDYITWAAVRAIFGIWGLKESFSANVAAFARPDLEKSHDMTRSILSQYFGPPESWSC